MPAGSPTGLTMYARRATSAMASERKGEPFTDTCPSATTRSSGGASRPAAAIPTIFSRTRRAARIAAPPPTTAPRLANVPLP